MCLREYSEEEIKEMFKADGYEEGMREGELKARAEAIKNIVEKFNCTADEAMDILKISAGDREQIKKMSEEK